MHIVSLKFFINMKKILFLFVAIALTGVFNSIHAQNKNELSDKALSAQYKHEIDVLNLEIKTLKVKLKGDPKNREFSADLDNKQAQLKEVKSKKKIIDDAIKSQAASEKAAKKAEKAEKQAQQRANEAQKIREKEK